MAKVLGSVLADERLFAILVTAFLVATGEVGFQFGRRAKARGSDGHSGGVEGAVLGLLGLLLGFTFSMGITRYDQRRALVVKEANAIGTTWLRAGLLPVPHEQGARDLLREYVAVRIELHSSVRDAMKIEADLRRSAEIESALWRHAQAAAGDTPTPLTATFVTALNDMIDTDAERVAAGRSSIPGGVWLALLLVASTGCFTSAYMSGFHGVRSSFTSAMLPLLVAAVIVLIFDVMHADQGIVDISQQPLIELQTTMRSPS